MNRGRRRGEKKNVFCLSELPKSSWNDYFIILHRCSGIQAYSLKWLVWLILGCRNKVQRRSRDLVHSTVLSGEPEPILSFQSVREPVHFTCFWINLEKMTLPKGRTCSHQIYTISFECPVYKEVKLQIFSAHSNRENKKKTI